MTAELWYGRKPRPAHVQQALVDLYYHLFPQTEHLVVLCNFRLVANYDIDLVVLKRDGIFMAEVCHAWDPIVGECEGEWKALKPDGTQVALRPGRLNPFKQLQTHYCDWRDWLTAHANEMGVERSRFKYPDIFSYIIFYPDVPPGSRIEIGKQPIQVAGLQKFLTALLLRSSARGEFSRQQLELVPRLLDLEAWKLAAPGDDPHRTQKLGSDWQPARVPALIALGHQLSAPTVHLNDHRSLRVGREDDNDLIVRHPAVSRHHAEMLRTGSGWAVRDLGSDNGTFISLTGESASERAVSQSPELVMDRTIVRFGPAAYVVVL